MTRWISKKVFHAQILLITVTLLSLVLSGCQQKEKVPEGPRQVRIATLDENVYKLEFKPFFSGQFPDWDITVLPMNDLKLYEKKGPEAIQLFTEFLEREKPDLVIMNSILYEVLADKEIFRDLGEWVSRDDGVNLDSFVPGVIDILKDNEEGKLFGLSPGFHTSVLYYNKTMFRSYGVEEPHDRMTWSEVLKLSNRFTQDRGLEKGSHGFYEPGTKTPFDLVQMIAGTEGMHYTDKRTAKVTLQSGEWRKVWDLVADSYRQGSIGAMDRKLKEIDGTTYVTEADQKAMDLFYKGKTAMTIGQNDLLQKLKGKPPSFEWGVYSGPVSTRDPERVSSFNISLVFTIPTVSAQPDAAWEAIRQLHSDKMGKIMPQPIKAC